MKPKDPGLLEHLAREYTLGTLPWRVRRRVQTLLKTEPALRQAVSEWERRLTPLAASVPELTPPPRVWQAIEQRLGHRPRRSRWWNSLPFWRSISALVAMAALALGLTLLNPAPEPAPPTMMVVVMEDVSTRSPAMTVAWEPGPPTSKMLRIRVMGHAEMAPDTSWELWLLPGAGQAPVSLGLITTHEEQTMMVPPALAARLDEAWGLAMSVEPKHGSPTGAPTGPVLYKGQCVKA